MTIDVVYPLGTGSAWNDNELRFSLRSLMRYVEDLGRIIIVGHKPSWLDVASVLHIPMADSKGGKDRNMIRKVLAACDHVSGPFVRMSDDQCVLRSMRFADLPAYGRRAERLGECPTKRWSRNKYHTQQWLAERGLSFHDFDLHCPMPCDPKIFRQMGEESVWQNEKCTINTLYGNMAGLIPHLGDILYYHSPPGCHRKIFSAVRGPMFLNYNNKGLDNRLRYALTVMFPDWSPAETADHSEVFDPNDWIYGRDSRPRIRPEQPQDKSRRRRRQASHASLRAIGPAGRRRLRARRGA